ncbi:MULTISPECIES: proline dehydrogenase family protein [unclassified Paenibacillus]|uniref:proline dehydrogenase family protein n=1 Tax=unclassified Paenibacillus TaxID=185978 RepID=UPI001AE39B70|nr:MULTISPECIES: proline dehydrogenase family protein [unclassified Paenibacillus]MBP1156171.1 proline dehydrogenase [Paenibacillus sp. PvP091]MBP1168443.1 proline dehydrogenase [Paenibacillus sp. PvR098]MBP2439471.1 proline dehydrogenase [Paenibacillus sp. PvP052]
MDIGTKLFRSTLLALAGNRAVEATAHRYGMKLGASRFVAGETADEALLQIRRLNDRGIAATLDVLGESIRDLSEADRFKREYIMLLERIHTEDLDSNVSLKPTQMGLALDPPTCLSHIRDIVRKAQKLGSFVRIDMENSPYTDDTIAMIRCLHAEGLTQVGTVIQAYLYRSREDVRRLTKANVNLRLVKGAYQEPKPLAYQNMNDVNANMKQLIRVRLDSGVYTAVATHDEQLIAWTKAYAKRNGVRADRYEFQMLYGVRMPLQEQLAREGHKVRCYVPYGRMWYPYFVRRLAERPANLWFVLKNWRDRPSAQNGKEE